MKSFLRKSAIAVAALTLSCSYLMASVNAAEGADKVEGKVGTPEFVISEINFELGDKAYAKDDKYVFDVVCSFDKVDKPIANYSLIVEFNEALYVENIDGKFISAPSWDTDLYRTNHVFSVNYASATTIKESGTEIFTITFSTDKAKFDELIKGNFNEEKGVYEYQYDIFMNRLVKVGSGNDDYTAAAGNNNGFIYGYSETTTAKPVETTPTPVETTPTPVETTPAPAETTATTPNGLNPDTGVTDAGSPLAVAGLIAVIGAASAAVVLKKKND